MAEGSVSRDVVITVLMTVCISSSVSIRVDNGTVFLVKDGIPEVYPLPDPVPRRMLHRLASKYDIRVEFFYHPEMCCKASKTKQ